MKFFNVMVILGVFTFSNASAQSCDASLFTQTPTGLYESINFSQLTITLIWDQYPNATACMVLGNKSSEPLDFPILVGNVTTPGSPNNLEISIQNLSATEEYRWRVICGCSLNPVVASPFSSYSTFTIMTPDP